MIDDQIVAIPAFQEEGRFSKEQFQTVLSLNGLTPLGFRAKLAEESAVNQAQAGFALSSFATPLMPSCWAHWSKATYFPFYRGERT